MRFKLMTALCLLSLASSIVISTTPNNRVRALASSVIDVNNRQAVIDAYKAEFERDEPAMQYTGNITTCTPGTTSVEYQNSVLQRVNWYRKMAGVPEVVYNSANHAAAQAGALISAAEGFPYPAPSSTAKCFSELGYSGATQSNIVGEFVGVRAIDAYVRNWIRDNPTVAQRRQVLSPKLRSIATGDLSEKRTMKLVNAGSKNTDERTSTYDLSFNALFVNDTGPAITPRDGGVAWPPSGYVPGVVIPSFWSYTRADADFSNAQVTVSGPRGAVNVTVESRGNIVDPGIVFSLEIPDSKKDVKYTVTISGIAGIATSTISYSVIVVDVNHAPKFKDLFFSSPPCSTEDIRIVLDYLDFDGDKYTLKLANTSADGANLSYRRIKSVVFGSMDILTLKAKGKKRIDPTQTSLTFDIKATDSRGASRVQTITANLPEITPTTLCPPVKISIRKGASGALVSWSKNDRGVSPTRYVVKVGSKSCKSKRTSCVIKGLANGRHTVQVIGYRKGSSPAPATSQLQLK